VGVDSGSGLPLTAAGIFFFGRFTTAAIHMGKCG
jgi:hypothetical protein